MNNPKDDSPTTESRWRIFWWMLLSASLSSILLLLAMLIDRGRWIQVLEVIAWPLTSFALAALATNRLWRSYRRAPLKPPENWHWSLADLLVSSCAAAAVFALLTNVSDSDESYDGRVITLAFSVGALVAAGMLSASLHGIHRPRSRAIFGLAVAFSGLCCFGAGIILTVLGVNGLERRGLWRALTDVYKLIEGTGSFAEWLTPFLRLGLLAPVALLIPRLARHLRDRR